MNGLALCSGIGGLELALRMAAGVRTVCHVERDSFAASVLVARMAEAALDQAPIWDDLSTFDASAWRGCVDIVSAGFPCQPFSVAGKQRGTDDERHLWPHVARIIRESGASLAFLENVPGLVGLGITEVLGDLAEMGFDAEWGCLSASEVGAPHGRERIFILAYANGEGEQQSKGCLADLWGRTRDGGEDVGDADLARLEGRLVRKGERADERPAWPPGPEDSDGWAKWIERRGSSPVLCRGVDEPAAWLDRADRLRCLGNAVVPAQAAAAFRLLVGRVMKSQNLS